MYTKNFPKDTSTFGKAKRFVENLPEKQPTYSPFSS